MLDVVIRGGTVVDGTGAPGVKADVGVKDGKIVEVGTITTPAARTVDATGKIVTPGFVDIHTHFDGQASWDETFSPSIFHGVTTVVFGNCGVGFAPVRKGQEQRLVSLMEGVEEIPGAALAEGVKWGWETFEDYMRLLNEMPHSLDFMTLVPHDCLRLYVMGDRAARCEPATAEDRRQMEDLLRAALKAGAAGFATGRSDNHRTSKGEETPAYQADRDELVGLARVLSEFPYRVLHAVSDFDCNRGDPDGQRARFDAEYAILEAMAEAAKRPIALTWLERINSPQQWEWLSEAALKSAEKGIDVRLQSGVRAIGLLNGLDTSFSPLMAFPSYQEIAHLPVPERAARMRDPALKARMLAEKPVKMAKDGSSIPPLADEVLAKIDQAAMIMFPFDSGKGPNYEPEFSDSFGFRAMNAGVPALSLIYDYLCEGEGRNLVYFPIMNYMTGGLDVVHKMLTHPRALASLGDAGAHVGTVCDASWCTTFLGYWTKERTRGDRIPLERVVEMLTSRNARHMGLQDRGVIAVGKRADLNVIDHAALKMLPPELVRDLPAGGKRFVQRAAGYELTMLGGVVVCERGTITAARPGHLVRGAA